MTDHKTKTELLSPAGDYETFIGAVNAGADAVYLAGQSFGARAYANNFNEEELIRALEYAHLHNCKIYLTLNTLVKEREFGAIYDFLRPLYENGLDGIIVQDIGVMRYIRAMFPNLPLHVSTQAAIANAESAIVYRELGAVRIVPARELSLSEIRSMKQETGLEIETFIHGAICYCYSGLCLFSSILGGRSGNRGRCAQPCRLPYRHKSGNGDQYLLSLKDMCSIELLKEILDAGIDSLKIEGRMKSPEYSAGVTGIYRKYLDRYYDDPTNSLPIERNDMDTLRSLYVRKSIQDGYYHKRNGRDMITLNDPSYLPPDEVVCNRVREQYLERTMKIDIQMAIYLTTDCESILVLTEPVSGISVTVSGELVQEALNNPVTEDMIRKQILKLGNTNFNCTDLTVEMSDNCYIGVKSLNELRRTGKEQLEEELLATFRRVDMLGSDVTLLPESEHITDDISQISVLCTTMEQWNICQETDGISRIYLDYLLYMKMYENGFKCQDVEIYVALPHILRQDKMNIFKRLADQIAADERVSGVLVRDHGQMHFLRHTYGDNMNYVSDTNLYAMNRCAIAGLYDMGYTEYTYPYELNKHELKELKNTDGEMIVYSHIPLMISANCIRKTMNECDGSFSGTTITDRQNKKMEVRTCCDHCYNVIYNSIPYSLNSRMSELRSISLNKYRIEFYKESDAEVRDVLNAFLTGSKTETVADYTTGHFNRGIQ